MTNKTTKPRKLTAKQEAFCVNYFVMRNATQAAIAAGYSPLFARENAPKLLQSNTVSARIKEMAEALKQDAIGTVEERMQRLTTIYRANLVDFVDENGQVKQLSKDIPHHAALSEYSVTSLGHDDGEQVTKRTLKLRDPIAAIQEHNKMEHIYTEGAQVNNQTINILVMSPESKELTKRLLSGQRGDKGDATE